MDLPEHVEASRLKELEKKTKEMVAVTSSN